MPLSVTFLLSVSLSTLRVLHLVSGSRVVSVMLAFSRNSHRSFRDRRYQGCQAVVAKPGEAQVDPVQVKQFFQVRQSRSFDAGFPQIQLVEVLVRFDVDFDKFLQPVVRHVAAGAV